MAWLRIVFAVAFCFATWADAGAFADDAEHGHSDSHAAAHDDGVPGLLPAGDLVMWSIVTFGLMLAILWKFAWAPLMQGLDVREAGVKQNIAAAEQARVKSEAMLRDYESKLATAQAEVKEIIAEARRDAERTKSDIIATAQKEAELLRERSVQDIARAKDAALEELMAFMSDNVVSATQRVLERTLSSDDQSRLIAQAIGELNPRRN